MTWTGWVSSSSSSRQKRVSGDQKRCRPCRTMVVAVGFSPVVVNVSVSFERLEVPQP